jgi:hypothetical protein
VSTALFHGLSFGKMRQPAYVVPGPGTLPLVPLASPGIPLAPLVPPVVPFEPLVPLVPLEPLVPAGELFVELLPHASAMPAAQTRTPVATTTR